MKTIKIIRKSPAVILKGFLALQLAGIAIFFLAGILFHFAKIYRTLPLASGLLSFQIAQAIFVFSGETLLILFIFFSWYKDFLEIKKDRLIHHRGILFRKRQTTALTDLQALTYRQGPLGRLVRYGTLEWKESSSSEIKKFSYLPEPQNMVNLILRLKNSVLPHNQSNALPPYTNLEELLARPEDEQLEFKSSLRWDLQRQQVNKELEKATLKTVTAFLNSRGGHLVIGVSDDRQPLGLKEDFKSLPKSDADGFTNHFTNLFRQHIGAEFWPYIKTGHHQINNQVCFLISTMPSPQPVFLKLGRDEEFYVRTGNNSSSLPFSQAQNYINQRFKKN